MTVENSTNDFSRLVIVSNRLPVVIDKQENQIKTIPGSGGLVTALAPVLKNRGGVWVGWPGAVDEADRKTVNTLLAKEDGESGFILHPVYLTDEEVKLYYEGFANEVIWPLFHDLQSLCNFKPIYWYAMQEVNRKFAEETAKKLKSRDFLWVHDYHLMLVGHELRKLGINSKISFFLHIPFPPLDIFVKLPWRFQILHALLEYDLIGFQTLRDQHNFIQCVKRLLPEVKVVNAKQFHLCQTATREVRIGTFPISIDYKQFSEEAAGKEVASQAILDQKMLKGLKVVFSCDRLDISKGILYRLEAIRFLLNHHPELHEKVIFLQIVVPSRQEITAYHNLKEEIDRKVGEINSQFTKTGWVPIHHIYHSISFKELLSYYRISDIALITPVKDGMNLVAKEFVAANVNETGVLVLSEFAGAVAEMQNEAFLINPYDIEGVAGAVYKALTLPPEEAMLRMRRMRRFLRRHDVFWWVQNFLKAAFSKKLDDFPVIQQYVPVNHKGESAHQQRGE